MERYGELSGLGGDFARTEWRSDDTDDTDDTDVTMMICTKDGDRDVDDGDFTRAVEYLGSGTHTGNVGCRVGRTRNDKDIYLRKIGN
jgi:hypothetical protein